MRRRLPPSLVVASEIAGLEPLSGYMKQEKRVTLVRLAPVPKRRLQPEFIERKMTIPEPGRCSRLSQSFQQPRPRHPRRSRRDNRSGVTACGSTAFADGGGSTRRLAPPRAPAVSDAAPFEPPKAGAAQVRLQEE